MRKSASIPLCIVFGIMLTTLAWSEGLGGPRGETRVAVHGGSYVNITPARLRILLTKKDFFFVNVHTPYEGEIAPTDAFIPFDRTVARLGEYPADKSAKIVVYCRSGRMSTLAAEELARQGYVNVLNLAGGMIEWEASALPLKRTQGQ